MQEEAEWEVEDDTEIYVNKVKQEQLPDAVTREMLQQETA